MIFDPSVTLPDTIFPIATVKWIGTDPDGDQTIANYLYSINDTFHFKPLSGSLNIMTLTKDSGLVQGNTCIYMKAQDNAHAFSNIIRMPQDSTKFFFVKSVTSKILLIKDVPTSLGELNNLNDYLSQVMDTIHYDVLDIKSNNGNLIPKIINPMFIETLKLFNIVMWIANRNGGANPYDDPNLSLAQNSLPYYINSGGKVFWSSGFPNVSIVQGALFNFAPIDSIKTNCFVQLLNVGDSTYCISDNTIPKLKVSGSFIAVTKGFYPSSGTKTIYQLLPRTNCIFYDSLGHVIGGDTLTVGIKNSASNPNLYFLLMPIYYLNGDINASKTFMHQMLITDFHYGTVYDNLGRNKRRF
jgi:hypothetical protein